MSLALSSVGRATSVVLGVRRSGFAGRALENRLRRTEEVDALDALVEEGRVAMIEVIRLWILFV